MSFSTWLQREMQGRGDSQESLAREVGVSLATVSRWVRGVSEPSYKDLWRLRQTFGRLPFDDAREAREEKTRFSSERKAK
jgi:transcriptional regulator with XRE-family HTH domain